MYIRREYVSRCARNLNVQKRHSKKKKKKNDAKTTVAYKGKYYKFVYNLTFRAKKSRRDRAETRARRSDGAGASACLQPKLRQFFFLLLPVTTRHVFLCRRDPGQQCVCLFFFLSLCQYPFRFVEKPFDERQTR